MKDFQINQLLDYLRNATENHLKKHPLSMVEEGDLQAFFYGKISEYFEKNGLEDFFIDEDKDKISMLHCEYPRNLKKIKSNQETSLVSAGRYDIVLLKKPTKDEHEMIKLYSHYPVDIAFEVHAGWNESDRYVEDKIDSDARVFGWGESVFEPDAKIKRKRSPEGTLFKREYPNVGVIFHIYMQTSDRRKNHVDTESKILQIEREIGKYEKRKLHKRKERNRRLYIILRIFKKDGSVAKRVDRKIEYKA